MEARIEKIEEEENGDRKRWLGFKYFNSRISLHWGKLEIIWVRLGLKKQAKTQDFMTN